MNYLINILLIFLLIYFFILISTYIFQRKLLYHPGENNYYGDKILVNVEKIKIRTKDNIDLLIQKLPDEDKKSILKIDKY